jgi:hypothetical protein
MYVQELAGALLLYDGERVVTESRGEPPGEGWMRWRLSRMTSAALHSRASPRSRHMGPLWRVAAKRP